MDKVPVNDAAIYALARLVDDAQTDRRDPSHSDIEFQINKAGLTSADPNKEGPPIGKAKGSINSAFRGQDRETSSP